MLQPRRNCSAVIVLIGATSLCGQIRQSDNLRAEQIVTEQRLRQQMRQEEQQHQAQLDQMQRINQQDQVPAAQEPPPQPQPSQHDQKKAQDRNSTPVFAPPVQTRQTAAPSPQPVAVSQWSWKNFTLRDDIGLAALGLLLGALAFKAAIPLRHRS